MAPAAASGGPLGETLAAFAESPGAPLTTREVADAAGCSRRTAYDRLQRLADRGAVETKKVGARGRVWWRPRGDAGSDGAPCVTPSGSARECVPADAVDAADVAVMAVEDGEVAWASAGVERYFGLDGEAVVGRDDRAVVREVADVLADGEAFVGAVPPFAGDGRRSGTVVCHVTGGPDRDERRLEHHSQPVESGRCAGGRVDVYYDVTERERAEPTVEEPERTESTVEERERSEPTVEEPERTESTVEERERALRAERDRLERILETSPIGLAVFAADGSTVAGNEEAADVLGVTPEEVDAYELGDRTIRDGSGTPLPYDERPVARAFATGEPVEDMEVRVEEPGGGLRWVRADAAPVEDESGTVTHVVAAMTDVTRLKEQSRQLARRRDELEHELEEVFERVDDAFLALDDEWRFTYVNDRAETLLDRPAGELLGRNVWKAFPGATETIVRERAETAMRTQEPVHFDLYYDPLDFWADVHLHPSETGLSVYFRDVTERKERERELQRYETVVETVEDGIFAVDPEGRFTMVNDALCEMTGYDRERVLGAYTTLVHSEAVDEQIIDLADEVEATGGSATLEFDLQPRDGDPVPVECRFAPYEYGGDAAFTGVVRDVSERRQFEETLTALHDTTRDLFEAATATEVGEVVVDAATGVIDLAGVVVYRYDADADELVPDAESLAEGFMRETMPVVPADHSSITADVFLEGEQRQYDDIRNSPHLQDGAEGTDMRGGLFVPMDDYGILVAGSDVVGGIDEGTRQLVELLAASAVAAYDRVDREQQLRRQRDRLRALDDLNAVVRGINEALVVQSSRAEVAEVVCERLAASDSYRFAWFGDVDPKTGVVESEVEVGVDGYLPEIRVSTGSDDVADGPISRAVRTHEVQVVDDALEDPAFGPWREYAREYDYRSAAAVPVVHEGTLYGLVGVYGEEPGAFGGEQRAVVSQLGTVVGHALAAIERKRALMSDEVVEVEFRIRDVYEVLGAERPADGTVRFERAVPAGDGTYLVYGSADEAGLDGVRTLADRQSHWEALSVLSRDQGRVTFEVAMSEPPVISTVAARGGYLERATVDDGDYHMTLHLPPGSGVRQVIDAVEGHYPAAEMLTRRQVTRSGEAAEPLGRTVVERLSDRQRAALEAAYYSGYFEWPRDSTGEDVAESLGVSAPTFHQHVRHAQHKLLEALYEDGW